jgi:hypothetical protein
VKAKRNTGNQHASRRRDLLGLLDAARFVLGRGNVLSARAYLITYRLAYALAPASTRRRWRCGR